MFGLSDASDYYYFISFIQVPYLKQEDKITDQ